MFKKLNLYIFLLFFSLFVNASNDEKNSLIEIYDNPNDINLINIVVKDNIDIGGKVTSAGSLALKDNIAKSDAFIIDKLKRANYYILGKANLSEWANFRSEIQLADGQVWVVKQNIFLMIYNPCGSSSGSAVAVSMGIVDIAIGTETNGSISCPSSVNGIVGMKPTTGLVSRSGIIPISSSQDTAGPMGATVDIVAKTLEVISGYDENDPATSFIPSNFDFNFSSATNNISLKGIRLGLLDSKNSNPQVIELHKKLQEIVNSLGGELILIDDDRDYPGDAESYVLLYEFRVGLEEYLKNANSSMKKLTDIIDFNNANKDIVMPYFGQDIFYKSIESTSYLKYLWSKYKINKSYQSTKELIDKYDLDAFIGLTRGPAWKINYDGGDYVAMNNTIEFGSGGYAAHNGMPHITIPYFEINKFPVGISIIGDRWTDKIIIGYASAIEKSRYNLDTQ